MRDITSKQISLRTAIAIGVVYCSPDIISLAKNNALPKGNLFDTARAAGFLAAKNTHNLIPHCHPVSIDSFDIQFTYLEPGVELDDQISHLQGSTGIIITAEAKSIGRTGIEMEALTAVSISGLTIYDLLKPLGNKDIEIGSIKLLDKKGGKTDREKYFNKKNKAAILVCSDATAAGKRKDSSGLIIQEMLLNYNCEIHDYKIVPDEKDQIQEIIRRWVKEDVPFIFTTGGTGLGPRDHTVEAVREIIERDAPGITEAMRTYGGMRTPVAMMSRAIAGSIKETLIVTMPGSSNGAKESMEAILPVIFHARPMMLGGGH